MEIKGALEKGQLNLFFEPAQSSSSVNSSEIVKAAQVTVQPNVYSFIEKRAASKSDDERRVTRKVLALLDF